MNVLGPIADRVQKTLQRRGKAVTAVAVATLCTACSSNGSTQTVDDLTSAAALLDNTPSRRGPSDSPRIRPTVEPPGPLDDVMWGDDLLVVGTETLPDDLVEQIEAIEVNGGPGVAATEQFSLGQISIESKVFDLAAVDPAGFRRFAGEDADFQDQWDRVANGEIAVLESLGQRLPLDDDGYFPVGTGDQVRDIHLGAYSTHQVGTIDALVNEPWGEELHIPADNALLISTGLASPQVVRDRIEKLAPDLSVSALDIVAETGIDPGTVQSVAFVGTFADAVGVFNYTPIGGGRVAPDPGWVKSHIATETVPILGSVTCNRYMMPQLKAALAEVQSAGLADELHPGEYAGCYYPRFIAGSTTLSNHSFGLALDLNVPGNQRGTVGEMNRTIVAIFKRWGFAWGGDWAYTDPMHFELERIVNPG